LGVNNVITTIAAPDAATTDKQLAAFTTPDSVAAVKQLTRWNSGHNYAPEYGIIDSQHLADRSRANNNQDMP
jgi:hypothetical protein